MERRTVVVVGSDALAQTCALLLVQSSSMRKEHSRNVVSSIILVDDAANLKNTHSPIYFSKYGKAVESVAHALARINAGIIRQYDSHAVVKDGVVIQYNSNAVERISIDAMPYATIDEAKPFISSSLRPDVVIDCKNDKDSWQDTLDYSKDIGACPIFAAADAGWGGYSFKDYSTLKIGKTKQGAAISGVIGGLVIENVKRFWDNAPIIHKFQFKVPKGASLEDVLSNKTVCVIGAGALGNVSIPELVLSGANVKVVDHDDIETKNFDRQYLYHPDESLDTISKYKANICELRANRLAENCQAHGRCSGTVRKINSNDDLSDIATDADIILLNVDNDKTRMIVSDFAIKNSKPVIDVAIDDDGGRIAGFYPNKTKCLTHKLQYEATRGKPCGDVAVSARILGSLSAIECFASMNRNPLCGGSIWYENGIFVIKEQSEIDMTCNCTKSSNYSKDELSRRYDSFVFDDRKGPRRLSSALSGVLAGEPN